MRHFTRAAALSLLFLGMPSASHSMEIIAHRGASADAPENTLAAMELAWKQGADAIELDLWLSKDGRLVVFHDATPKRYNGQTNRVSDSTWEELHKLDVGAWKGEQFKGLRMPTLPSILDTIPEGRRAVLEIKCGPEILPELERALARSGRKATELAIISFDFDAVEQSKRRFPKIEHYFLHGYKKDASTGQFPEIEPLIERCKAARLDGLDLEQGWPVTKEFVTRIHQAGLKLVVWTVNDAEVAKRWAAAGVDGITTDRPGWLREQLRAPR